LNQIKTLTTKIGEGSREIRQEKLSSFWQDYDRAKSSPIEVSLIEAEADKLLEEIENLLEQDPLAALGTPLGDIHMNKYGFLAVESKSDYPYKFTVRDILTEAPYICAQLVAEEYYEDGPEACPFTPEAFIGFDFENNRNKPKEWVDPFETIERPKATIELNGEEFNLNAPTGS
jgi:hypothetical protein